MSPRPGAWSSCDGERLRILRARAAAGVVDSPPGTVRCGDDPPVRVATGSGWLVPLELQREGGRPLAVADFQRGRALRDGARLGA
jgi:methionyl-tRNA formyltransferase